MILLDSDCVELQADMSLTVQILSEGTFSHGSPVLKCKNFRFY